ncbi:MAG: hypothetical protein E7590_05820 [Ruminococcaceae bacterium]|nr:hypothetical protein [Oscillospiraceae bacterium]
MKSRGDSMIAFLKNRGRALVVMLFTALSFVIFPLLTAVACRFLGEWFNGIVAGILLMVLALVLHRFGDMYAVCYVISFLLNTVGMGCFASSYYLYSGIPSALPDLLPSVLLPLGLMLIICAALTAFPQIKHVFAGVGAILLVGSIVTAIVFWVRRGGEFYAFSLFSLLVAGFHLCVCMATVNEPERCLLRDVSFGGFGMFGGVGIAVLIAIFCIGGDGCDCDCCDCYDCCDWNGGGSKRKKKKLK